MAPTLVLLGRALAMGRLVVLGGLGYLLGLYRTPGTFWFPFSCHNPLFACLGPAVGWYGRAEGTPPGTLLTATGTPLPASPLQPVQVPTDLW